MKVISDVIAFLKIKIIRFICIVIYCSLPPHRLSCDGGRDPHLLPNTICLWPKQCDLSRWIRGVWSCSEPYLTPISCGGKKSYNHVIYNTWRNSFHAFHVASGENLTQWKKRNLQHISISEDDFISVFCTIWCPRLNWIKCTISLHQLGLLTKYLNHWSPPQLQRNSQDWAQVKDASVPLGKKIEKEIDKEMGKMLWSINLRPVACYD